MTTSENYVNLFESLKDLIKKEYEETAATWEEDQESLIRDVRYALSTKDKEDKISVLRDVVRFLKEIVSKEEEYI